MKTNRKNKAIVLILKSNYLDLNIKQNTMRKFRFIGNPVNPYQYFVKNKVYIGSFVPDSGLVDVCYMAKTYPEDWKKVFDEQKLLHKDTDLGYFTSLFINYQSLSKVPPDI